MLAEFEGHDLVLTQHVRGAFDVVLRGPRSRPWANEIASTLGGILFGFGASAFVSEASRNEGLRLWHTVVFVVLTIIGVVVALVAALTKR